MSKLRDSMKNPCPYMGVVTPDENGKVTIPPEQCKTGISKNDVRTNPITSIVVGYYKFEERDGEIIRIGADGKEFPPLTQEQRKEVKKYHEEKDKQEANKDDMDR